MSRSSILFIDIASGLQASIWATLASSVDHKTKACVITASSNDSSKTYPIKDIFVQRIMDDQSFVFTGPLTSQFLLNKYCKDCSQMSKAQISAEALKNLLEGLKDSRILGNNNYSLSASTQILSHDKPIASVTHQKYEAPCDSCQANFNRLRQLEVFQSNYTNSTSDSIGNPRPSCGCNNNY